MDFHASVDEQWVGNEGPERYLMAASNIYLVMDAGSPKAAFTTRGELQAYLRRRLDVFVNPLVCTFWGQPRPVNHDHVGGAGGTMSVS